MSVLDFVEKHWEIIIATPVLGALGIVSTNLLASPVWEFRSERRKAIRAVEALEALGVHASPNQLQDARAEVSDSASMLQGYATGASAPVSWYCRVRRLDLEGASACLRSLMVPMLLEGGTDHQRLKGDSVRACLGATRRMSKDRIKVAREAAQRTARSLAATHYKLDVGNGQSPGMERFSVALSHIQIVWQQGWPLLDAFLRTVLAKKIDAIPLKSINAKPRPSVIMPALAAIPLTYAEPDLQEIWANLIASEMDCRTAEGVLPSFVEIVKALTPDEAKILNTIKSGDAVPIVRIQRKEFDNLGRHIGGLDVEKNLTHIGFKAGCEFPKLARAYLDNLARWRLIEFQIPGTQYHPSLYHQLETDPDIQALKQKYDRPPRVKAEFVYSGLELTEFGRAFIKACVDPTWGGPI